MVEKGSRNSLYMSPHATAPPHPTPPQTDLLTSLDHKTKEVGESDVHQDALLLAPFSEPLVSCVFVFTATAFLPG